MSDDRTLKKGHEMDLKKHTKNIDGKSPELLQTTMPQNEE